MLGVIGGGVLAGLLRCCFVEDEGGGLGNRWVDNWDASVCEIEPLSGPLEAVV